MSIVEQIITFSFSNRILYITSEEYDILKQRERGRLKSVKEGGEIEMINESKCIRQKI